MKVLLIGNGAREHIIAERLAEDSELYTIMSKKNPAIAQLSKKHWICDSENPDEVAKCITGHDFDLAFASPDAVLAAGVSDILEKHGILVASPLKSAARIEWDKAFMRRLMLENKVSGQIKYQLVNHIEDARKAIMEFGEVAIKPVGLTGGKGVRVTGDHFTTIEEGMTYVTEVFKKDGQVLIEEKLIGEEFSFQCFSDGTRIAVMPPVQDHKRAFEGDIGPNTGGMGSYSTGKLLPFLEEKDIEQATKILQETVHAMKKNGTPFKGVLYGQFMATKNGLRVVEFNSRFGDPEAMNVLATFEGSLADMLLSITDGKIERAKFSNKATVVKYLVPEGYPDKPLKDQPVTIDSTVMERIGAKIYYASVYEKEGAIYTTGSRAFGILGVADKLEDAEQIAEEGCRYVQGKIWHRKDIGTKELIEKRVQHMKELRNM
ncbi:MAG: phosphoribosylamine--glycine ligase [Candidatus Micrarchaeota archaeon]|nr:phosphoribosylamine--glycine ligase [Candidatus Micrarchaeota archaeon]